MVDPDGRARSAFLAERRAQFYPKADLALDDAELRTLAGLPQQVSTEEAGRALIAESVVEGSLAPMEGTGTFHELFAFTAGDGRRGVLKVNKVSELLVDRALLAEVSVSRRLIEHGVLHARVRLADCSRSAVPFDFQVMDHLDGASFRSFDTDEDAAVQRIPALAQRLAALHSIEADGFGLVGSLGAEEVAGSHAAWADYVLTRLPEHVSLVQAAGLVTAAEAEKIAATFSAFAALPPLERGRLLHGDCGPHNAVLSAEGEVSLIDWEDALVGDPVFEVAMWATFTPPRRWPVFFEAYFASPWQPGFLFWVYFLRISLAKAVVRLRFGYQDVPGRQPASLRIQQALAALEQLE